MTNLHNEISNFQQRFDESFHEAWDRYKDLLCACLHHGFTELHQLDTFYNALNPADQDSLNFAAGGNLWKDIAMLTHAVNQQTSAVTTAMTTILKQFQATPPPASVKAVEEICVTCGGAHPYYQCLAADGNTFPELRANIQGYVAAAAVNYNQGNSSYRPPVFYQMNIAFTSGSGPLPSNTIANPKGKLQAITTRSGIVLDRPSVTIPPPFINPEEDESVEETLTDQDLSEYTIKVPPPLEKLLELANTPLNENCSSVILKKLPEKLGDPGKFLIPCGFSELKCKALADLGASINLMPLSIWKKLGLPELISTRITLELANRAICTPVGIVRVVFVPVGKFIFPADFVIVDYESDPKVPLILGRPFLRTTRALIDVHEKEMILRDGDERLTLNMRHDTSSYSNQPQKESINMINIFNDSSEDFLENLFTTNHQSGSPTFSSHPKLTSPEVKDDIFDSKGGNALIEKVINLDSTKEPPLIISPLESDTEYVYDDPFDSKEEKIKESKLLIDELDLPKSRDFLPSPEYDSFLFEDFSEVDALPSTNNEDKVFNPGILIQKKPFEVITYVTPDKNVKKLAISHASLILEDFDPPLHELPFLKEVLGSKILLSFSSENEEKFSNPGLSLLKEIILLFSWKYLIGAIKFSKSLKLLKAQWRFFLASVERTSAS
nr:reverse transcriptase domain-containing protein [Tanacetum cinerariifolium]